METIFNKNKAFSRFKLIKGVTFRTYVHENRFYGEGLKMITVGQDFKVWNLVGSIKLLRKQSFDERFNLTKLIWCSDGQIQCWKEQLNDIWLGAQPIQKNTFNILWEDNDHSQGEFVTVLKMNSLENRQYPILKLTLNMKQGQSEKQVLEINKSKNQIA